MSERQIVGYRTDKNGGNKQPIYEGDRYVNGNSLKNVQNKKMREIEAVKSGDKQEWNLEHFFKGHIPELRELQKTLDVYERSFLFSISTYAGYEDCCLKHDNGVCLDFEDMQKICVMSRGKLSQVINQLLAKDVIYKGKNSKGFQYFVNPWLFCKGTRINVVLKTMFKNYKVLVMGGKAWGNIGLEEIDETSLLGRVKKALNKDGD